MESISRLSSMLETARDLTLDAARDAGAHRRPTRDSVSTVQLKKLLDSRNEREVLDGLRRVITLSQRNPPTPIKPPLLFSSVLKNIASPSLPVKKLVYIYLLAHAEAEPDTALLAINTIQKTLSASDPHLRALALRVMSGIRVPVISQIVSLAIKKGCSDVSPLVRKAAALAIPKCWRLNPSTAEQLVEYLDRLLGDKQYVVAGAAVSAYMECCPDRIDLIHQHYRSLLRKLVDMDEWSQLAMLRSMLLYARRCFPRRTKRVARPTATQRNGAATTAAKSLTAPMSPSLNAFYQDVESGVATPVSGTPNPAVPPSETETVPVVDPDLGLLLKAIQSLLQSRNAAVVVAVARLYYYLAPPPFPETEYLALCVGPLVSLLRNSPDVQLLALHNIIQVALVLPLPFLPHTRHFLLRSADSPAVQALKLELLTIIFPHAAPTAQSLILNELAMSCHNAASTLGTYPTGSMANASSALTASSAAEPSLLTASVRALGRCAQSSPPGSTTSSRCLRLLLSQLGSPNGALVAESLTVVRHLIQANPTAHVETVTRLAKHLDTLTSPEARATVIWLVGEFAGVNSGDNIAADVLRLLVRGFADEAEPAKQQIVLLAAKVYVHYLNAQSERQSKELQQRSGEDTSGLGNEHDNSKLPSTGDENAQLNGHHTTPNSPHIDIDANAPIPLLWTYILHLTRYDPSCDLRSRTRLYRALLSTPSSTQLATLLLLAPKPVPAAPSPAEARRQYTLGSASLVLAPELAQVGFAGYEAVPEWVKEGDEPDARLREEPERAPGPVYTEQGSVVAMSAGERLDAGTGAAVASGRVAPMAEKSLDDWLAESSDDEEVEVVVHKKTNKASITEEETEEDDEDDEEGSTEEESEEEDEDETSEDEKDERAKLMT